MSLSDEAAQALGRVPSGLFILTAGHGPAETGLLASWVQQCSFDPPRVSVAVKQGRDVADLLKQGAAFALHLIGEDQGRFLKHFGKGFAPGEPAFTGLAVSRPAGEATVLDEALGHLLCRVAGRFPAGDHDLFLGDIVGGRLALPDGKPMVHIRKSGLRY
ncbi:MAG: flavin reductase family protein [Gemmataceae bacterium]|nr:flavin reductase family protein [Gemmataceae bacterium]